MKPRLISSQSCGIVKPTLLHPYNSQGRSVAMVFRIAVGLNFLQKQAPVDKSAHAGLPSILSRYSGLGRVLENKR
ncbi:hypothetical protein [Paenibacillus agricola]|uniref:hypothetical protein n=1 Tax=Paenibacillus agricola TaxID=2716264 RepID=UPI001A9FA02E|nr:hypothetical protein [Paenibacillus agricola]